MSECYECLNTGTVLVCDECGTPSAEPRITPAMVANLLRRAHKATRDWGGQDAAEARALWSHFDAAVHAWAARENARTK